MAGSGGGGQGHDKGFSVWLGCKRSVRNSECGSVWGHLDLPFVFLKC